MSVIHKKTLESIIEEDIAKLTGKPKNLKSLVEEDLSKMMGKPLSNKNLWIWLVMDFLFIQLVLGPFNVMIWRGGWEIYDEIFKTNTVTVKERYPEVSEKNTVTGIIVFLAGFTISIPLVFFSEYVTKYADAILKHNDYGRMTFKYQFVTRAYGFLTFLTMLLYWKGLFDMLWNQPNKEDHHYFSAGCLGIGSMILMYLGCLKTAATSLPMGIYLDTAVQYNHVTQFFDTKGREDVGIPFRIWNAFLTLCIEVLALVTYFGAFQLVGYFFREVFKEPLGDSATSLIYLATAVSLSALSYMASIFYLKFLYGAKQTKAYELVTTIIYDLTLLMAVVATAFHFYAWWKILDDLKMHIADDVKDTLAEVLYLLVGMIVITVAGVGSGNNYGISWEYKKKEDGVLLPFIYLTYLFRDERKVSTFAADFLMDIHPSQ